MPELGSADSSGGQDWTRNDKDAPDQRAGTETGSRGSRPCRHHPMLDHAGCSRLRRLKETWLRLVPVVETCQARMPCSSGVMSGVGGT